MLVFTTKDKWQCYNFFSMDLKTKSNNICNILKIQITNNNPRREITIMRNEQLGQWATTWNKIEVVLLHYL